MEANRWKKTLAATAVAALGVLGMTAAHAQGSRLLATSGVTEVGGSTGGGLTPWAVISGTTRATKWVDRPLAPLCACPTTH